MSTAHMTPEQFRRYGREVVDWIGHYERFWTHKLDALERHLRRSP